MQLQDNRKEKKSLLRKQIKALKEDYSPKELDQKSNNVFGLLEQMLVFQKAKNIYVYHSLKDEVQTSDFIQKWNDKKKFFFPIIKDDNLTFREYKPQTIFRQAILNVMEPDGEDISDYSEIDIIIVPGIAFDINMNRLGRGKGFYDRFLSQISVLKIGVCFEFQLLKNIPIDYYDVKMDYIITENRIIGNTDDKKNNK